MALIGIVAVARNLAIGRGGKLPWHYPVDLKHFKRKTMGHALAMGFNTWQSIGRPLPERLSIVLSRTHTIDHQPNVLLLRTLDEVTALNKYLNSDLYVIGGAGTYQTFAHLMDEWIVTEIPETVVDADVFMPSDFLKGFEETRREEIGDGLVVRYYRRRGGLV